MFAAAFVLLFAGHWLADYPGQSVAMHIMAASVLPHDDPRVS